VGAAFGKQSFLQKKFTFSKNNPNQFVEFEAADPFSRFGNNKNFSFCPKTLPARKPP
jgi:hypothetical protein